MKTDINIILLGDPLLRLVSKPILENEFGTSDLKKLSEILFHMMSTKNGLGLAAPQLGISKRAVVFGMDCHPIKKHITSIPYTVLFNPSFEPITDAMEEDYEGCLSVGDLRGKVLRYKTIHYTGYDVEGTLIEREASNLHARVVQHEVDHLDGVIFIDKIQDYQTMGFHKELLNSGAYLKSSN